MYFKPHGFLKEVALTTARERLTTAETKVPAVVITGEVSNTGRIYVGDSQVSSTNYGADLGPGDSTIMSAAEMGWAGANISLKDIWLVPSVNTDGVAALYLERAE